MKNLTLFPVANNEPTKRFEQVSSYNARIASPFNLTIRARCGYTDSNVNKLISQQISCYGNIKQHLTNTESIRSPDNRRHVFLIVSKLILSCSCIVAKRTTVKSLDALL